MAGSSFRALGLVARRDISRHRGRSGLVVALIALPVAAMVTGIALLRTTSVSTERSIVSQMGRADLIAQGATREALAGYLPPGSVVEPVAFAQANLVLPGARPSVSVRSHDLDGLAAGMLTLLEGRLPRGSGEVAISEAVAKLAAVGVGGQVTLDDAPPVTVVGRIENPLYLADRVILVDPAAVPAGPDKLATWLIDLPEGVDPEAVVARTVDPVTGAQELLLQSRESGRIRSFGGDGSETIIVLGALALVEAALIASAAFAVSIRRRQRELGLLAAAGATPRQLGDSVVAGAAFLGLIACGVGVVAGLAGAWALTPWLDALTQHRNPPLVVDPLGLLGPTFLGFVAALIAAVVPARSVARLPVLVSLSGRRPPEASARRTLLLGIGAVAVSFAMTVIGASVRIDGAESMGLVLMVTGAVLGTLGFGACGPWLLERLEGLAVRLPLAGRIGFRDTARARSRSSPIVTAVLAGLAATIALGTFVVSRDAENSEGWSPWLYPNQLVVQGAAAPAAADEVARSLGAVAAAPIADLVVPEPAYFWIEVGNARDEHGEPVMWGEPPYEMAPQLGDAVVATPAVLAISHAEEAAGALAAGRIVIRSERGHENAIASADHVEFVFQDDPNAAEPTRRVRYPATATLTDITTGALPSVLVPASIADALGLVAWPQPDYVIELDHPVTDADLARATEIAGRHVETFAQAAFEPPNQGEAFRLLLIGLALVFAVSVTGIAIALGEAESRPEQRSLLALGADPRLRRRIAAARAAVLALLAGILAVPAGILPVWGLLASREAPFVVPWLEVAGAVVALPVLAVVAAWALSRPIPEWNAFRNVRPGE